MDIFSIWDEITLWAHPLTASSSEALNIQSLFGKISLNRKLPMYPSMMTKFIGVIVETSSSNEIRGTSSKLESLLEREITRRSSVHADLFLQIRVRWEPSLRIISDPIIGVIFSSLHDLRKVTTPLTVEISVSPACVYPCSLHFLTICSHLEVDARSE